MSLKINISTTEDIAFEGALLLAPASNYSDGEVKGFRPAIRWAMMKLPDTMIRNGLFNIKDQEKEATAVAAINAARGILFENDCMCAEVVDQMLEEWAAEV